MWILIVYPATFGVVCSSASLFSLSFQLPLSQSEFDSYLVKTLLFLTCMKAACLTFSKLIPYVLPSP